MMVATPEQLERIAARQAAYLRKYLTEAEALEMEALAPLGRMGEATDEQQARLDELAAKLFAASVGPRQIELPRERTKPGSVAFEAPQIVAVPTGTKGAYHLGGAVPYPKPGHGKAQSKVEILDPEGDPLQALADYGVLQDRKYEVDDLTPFLRGAARAFARAYEGDFDWMQKMARKARAGQLWEGEFKGVLNVMRAELRRRGSEIPNRDIEILKSAPTAPGAVNPKPNKTESNPGDLDLRQVPGRYFAIQPEGGGQLAFYSIRRPDETSRWHNWIFVDILRGPDRQAVGKQAPGKSYQGQHTANLRKIAADPVAAMALYGQTVQYCGRCGRRLTDQESRSIGIGPECRKLL